MLDCRDGIVERDCLLDCSNVSDCLLDCSNEGDCLLDGILEGNDVIEGNKEYDEIPLLDCNDVDVELTELMMSVLLVGLGLSGDWISHLLHLLECS